MLGFQIQNRTTTLIEMSGGLCISKLFIMYNKLCVVCKQIKYV